MAGRPVLHESTKKQSESPAEPRGIPLGLAVLYIIAAAGAWIIVLVLFHNLMARLLS